MAEADSTVKRIRPVRPRGTRPGICAVCGKDYRSYNSGGIWTASCGGPCARRLRRINDGSLVRNLIRASIVIVRVDRRHCEGCGRKHTAPTRAGSYCSEACKPTRVWESSRLSCKRCMGSFLQIVKRQVHCSDHCRAEAARATARKMRQSPSGRAAKQAYKARRRAREQIKCESFDPIAIFKRDGWTCQICMEPTPRKLRGTYDDHAPELDHVVPLAKGGSHTRDNVQCACRQCNALKSDKMPSLAA